jgi:hypothetical protein
MKAIKSIGGMVPLIVEYKHLSNDDAVRKLLDDRVEWSECENGIGSDEAETRRNAKVVRRDMFMHGPDHGLSIDERGGLKYRGPH